MYQRIIRTKRRIIKMLKTIIEKIKIRVRMVIRIRMKRQRRKKKMVRKRRKGFLVYS